MRRQENQQPRPAAGFLPLPLFNQKKRNRVPLTSAPSQNEFFSHCEFTASVGSDTSHSTPATYGCYQGSGPASAASQSHPWTTQSIPTPTPLKQYGQTHAPGPAPGMKHCAPISHPYKCGGIGSKMGQPRNQVRQQEPSSGVTEYQALCSRDSTQRKSTTLTGFSQMGQKSFVRPPNSTQSQQSRPLPAPVPSPNRLSAHAVQPQSSSWKFTNSFGPQRPPFEGNRATNQKTQTAWKNQETIKPAFENSLRILTALIDGMRHWSQFKDKVPYLFEIFATLDSAVTLGHHGAKSFLMRDRKEVVQCVFYENEQELPRLIRGQVHRCIGNYDRSRDVLVCVSVRPAQPSELMNAQEAVKTCNAEMRALVGSFSEV